MDNTVTVIFKNLSSQGWVVRGVCDELEAVPNTINKHRKDNNLSTLDEKACPPCVLANYTDEKGIISSVLFPNVPFEEYAKALTAAADKPHQVINLLNIQAQYESYTP